MSIWKHTLTLVALAMLAWPLADRAFAQRGERGGDDRGGGKTFAGGDGGDRGGRSFSGGGGGNNRAFSGGGRESSSRSFSDNFNRGNDRPQSIPRAFEGGQNMQGNQRANASATQQRSFYRGPGAQQLGRQQLDQQQFQRTQAERSRDFNRTWTDRTNEFNREQSSRDAHPEFRRDDRPNISGQFNNDRFDSNRFDQQFQDHDRFTDRDRDGREFNRRDGDRDRDWSEWARDRNRDRDWNRDGRDDWRWRGDEVRRDWWRGFAGAAVPFRYGWWDNYYGASWPVYSPWRYSRWQNQPYYWWGYTPATRLTDWLVFGWDRPRYWAYGAGANIYYRDNHVYYDDQATVTVDAYYQQVYDLAHGVPSISEAEAERMDWTPLGVFAAIRQNESDSQRALQLAVNRDGVITGTYMNRANGHVHPMSGMVDERTQRAAWAFADGQHKEVVFETGIYNLTRDEASMMVHFGPNADDTEVWQLVRLEEPEVSAGSAAGQTQTSARRNLP